MLWRLLPAVGAGFCLVGAVFTSIREKGEPQKGTAQGENERYVEETVCWKFKLGYERRRPAQGLQSPWRDRRGHRGQRSRHGSFAGIRLRHL